MSLKQKFFEIQHEQFDSFKLSLDVTKSVKIGGKRSFAYGNTDFTILINDPPLNGSCYMHVKDLTTDSWVEAYTGTSLIDTFRLYCDNDWIDPNKHRIVKYAFRLQNNEDGSINVLSSGPLREIIAVFPAGSFDVLADVYDEAGAYTTVVIQSQFFVLGPEKVDYDSFNLKEVVKQAKANGDSNLLAQILSADVSNKHSTKYNLIDISFVVICQKDLMLV